MKNLNHPFILDVYSLNKEQNYYIMECVDETLEDYVEQHSDHKFINENLCLSVKFVTHFNTYIVKRFCTEIFHRKIY